MGIASASRQTRQTEQSLGEWTFKQQSACSPSGYRSRKLRQTLDSTTACVFNLAVRVGKVARLQLQCRCILKLGTAFRCACGSASRHVHGHAWQFSGCDPSRSMTTYVWRWESPSSSTMEFSIVTNIVGDEDAIESVRERLLLHWVNSLPLTKCLLVEELSDLRFGDVLYEIMLWLQHFSDVGRTRVDKVSESDPAESHAMELLRRVIQFVASECRSQDEDAMYVVNDANCLVRVRSGENEAICAVLTVLKRLSIRRIKEHHSFESEKDALRRRRAQEQLIEHSLQQGLHENPESKQKPKRAQMFSSRSQTTVKATKPLNSIKKAGITEPKPTKQSKIKRTAGVKRRLGTTSASNAATNTRNTITKKKLSSQTTSFVDDKGLRAFGMLDPAVKRQLANETSSGECIDATREETLAVRFCNSARFFFNVEIPLKEIFAKFCEDWKLHPPRKVRLAFVSGDLLYRIAIAIVQRYGEQLNHNVPEINDLDFAVTNTLAGKRRKFEFALATFKVLGISPEAINSFQSLQRPGKQASSQTIWCALEEVLNRVERLAHTTVPPKTGITIDRKTPLMSEKEEKHILKQHLKSPQDRRKKTIEVEATLNELKGCAPVKRGFPYITSEQIHAVNKWLINVGFDIKKTFSHGVLQDPMRNGVLLCALLTQVFNVRSFSYVKTPRTLSEMRENIAKAFEKLNDRLIPPRYLTPCAEQSVLVGDRQVCYGILWHLWQASHATLSRGGSHSPSSFHEIRKPESVTLDRIPSASVLPSPLLLDVPAITLGGQGKLTNKDDRVASYQIKLHDTFARRLVWSENDPNGDHENDDVFPLPKAQLSGPVNYDDLVPTNKNEKEVKHKHLDDIWPTCSDRRGLSQTGRSPRCDQDLDKVAPGIAIGELSVAVAPTTDCVDSEKLEDHRDDSVMISPTKPSKAEVQQSTTFTQELVQEILAWLKRLGVHLNNTSDFHDSNAKLTEFQSGVILCCIVEKVEFMRSIPGITRPSGKQPLSKASALHNITKALNILKQKKTMPLHLLRRANAIYTGNRDVIVQLLVQIRKAYNHHLRRPKLSAAA